jgi:hypothetical protein
MICCNRRRSFCYNAHPSWSNVKAGGDIIEGAVAVHGRKGKECSHKREGAAIVIMPTLPGGIVKEDGDLIEGEAIVIMPTIPGRIVKECGA